MWKHLKASHSALCETHLNDVEDNILVEAVQDTLGDAVVVPGSVDEQQILQVFELRVRGNSKMNEQQKSVYSTLSNGCS